MDETTTIDLPGTECALTTSNDMEGLHFTFPNPEHRDLENSGIPVPQLMAYLAACYYRYNRDPCRPGRMPSGPAPRGGSTLFGDGAHKPWAKPDTPANWR